MLHRGSCCLTQTSLKVVLTMGGLSRHNKTGGPPPHYTTALTLSKRPRQQSSGTRPPIPWAKYYSAPSRCRSCWAYLPPTGSTEKARPKSTRRTSKASHVKGLYGDEYVLMEPANRRLTKQKNKKESTYFFPH